MRALILYNVLALIAVCVLLDRIVLSKLSDPPYISHHYSEQELRELHLERALELRVE